VKPHLTVDPIACAGHGVCAELFPERVRLDDWGFPIIDGTPIPAALMEHARRAVEACPKLALALALRQAAARDTPPPPTGAAGRAAG
jgi:ferredoxin